MPAAYDPHPMWSAPSKLRFFAALLVGLVAVIFVGSFAAARVVYTACSLSLLAYRVSYYAERGLLLYCVDFTRFTESESTVFRAFIPREDFPIEGVADTDAWPSGIPCGDDS